jgi:hypothetical protein
LHGTGADLLFLYFGNNGSAHGFVLFGTLAMSSSLVVNLPKAGCEAVVKRSEGNTPVYLIIAVRDD